MQLIYTAGTNTYEYSIYGLNIGKVVLYLQLHNYINQIINSLYRLLTSGNNPSDSVNTYTHLL